MDSTADDYHKKVTKLEDELSGPLTMCIVTPDTPVEHDPDEWWEEQLPAYRPAWF